MLTIVPLLVYATESSNIMLRTTSLSDVEDYDELVSFQDDTKTTVSIDKNFIDLLNPNHEMKNNKEGDSPYHQELQSARIVGRARVMSHSLYPCYGLPVHSEY
jgi:hypothetical protein